MSDTLRAGYWEMTREQKIRILENEIRLLQSELDYTKAELVSVRDGDDGQK